MSNDNLSFGLVSVARAPLEGRASAMATLDAALGAVEKDRKPRIVTIVGPAGIGKSRLVHEFVVRHRGGSALVPRVYRGSARDSDAAYGVFARLLRMRFGLTESMDQEAAKALVRQQVAKVTGDRKVGDVVYFLGQFLDLPFEDSPLTRAIGEDPSQARILLSAVFKAFLEADAAHSPMCLVFDDLHAAHGIRSASCATSSTVSMGRSSSSARRVRSCSSEPKTGPAPQSPGTSSSSSAR
jgi:predicted ATPase